eukprot:TRINITY_DN10206_c0_g1_i8.p1 TRINITY_DN10206_c0_g1~~TRINITY_DN10206_c0_g1_i8.p1  ORF type:complete len:212 (-),score=-8.64 TRINITY_DN10206_c0_g1_i8:65-700(-)
MLRGVFQNFKIASKNAKNIYIYIFIKKKTGYIRFSLGQDLNIIFTSFELFLSKIVTYKFRLFFLSSRLDFFLIYFRCILCQGEASIELVVIEVAALLEYLGLHQQCYVYVFILIIHSSYYYRMGELLYLIRNISFRVSFEYNSRFIVLLKKERNLSSCIPKVILLGIRTIFVRVELILSQKKNIRNIKDSVVKKGQVKKLGLIKISRLSIV